MNYGENVGMSLSESYGRAFGQNTGHSFSNSISNTESISQNFSHGSSMTHSIGETFGQTIGTSQGFSENMSQSVNHGINHSISSGQSSGYSFSQNHGLTAGTSQGFGTSSNQNIGISQGHSQGYSHNIGNSYNESASINNSASETASVSQSDSYNQSIGRSSNISDGVSAGRSQNFGTSESWNEGQSSSMAVSRNASTSNSYSHNVGSSQNHGVNSSYGLNGSDGYNQSTGSSWGQSHSYNQGNSFNTSNSFSLSNSASTGHTYGHTVGANNGSSFGGSAFGFNLGINSSGSEGDSASVSFTESSSFSQSGGWSQGSSWGESVGSNVGGSNSYGVNHSAGWSQSSGTSDSVGSSISDGFSSSSSVSNGISTSQGTSMGHGNSVTSSYGYSGSESHSVSNGMSSSESLGTSQSQSFSNGVSHGWGQSTSTGVNESTGINMSENMGLTRGYGSGTSANVSSSNSTSDSLGQSTSFSQNTGESMGTSDSYGYSQGVSRSETQSQSISNSISSSTSYGESYSESQGVSQSVGRSQSVGQTESMSYTENAGQSATQSRGSSQSVGQGRSVSDSTGRSLGQSIGATGAYATSSGGSMGLGPSFSYSKSYQWMDQSVKDILEILEFENARMKNAVNGNGAFYTYVYIACPTINALSAAKALAKSSWQNDNALKSPLQVLDLGAEEQRHLLYHFTAFSADVTRIDVFGRSDYKYATVLLPSELVAYTHPPRVSEGGIWADVNDIPKFAVPAMMKGEIYMGTVLSAERFTIENGYKTQHDYRIDEAMMMHGFFTGKSRSGKTVAAMRFIAELSQTRRKSTGKRFRIVCMDPKNDWRSLARFVEPERFKFYSLGNINFHPIHLNPCKIPYGVWPQLWIDGMIDIYCRAYGLLERGKQMMGETIYELYKKAGVFDAMDKPDWKETVPELSKQVTFGKIYKHMERIKISLEDPDNKRGKAGNDTRDAYARLLDRLQAFDREYSIEHRLFASEDGMGIDDLIGADDITVLESSGLESTFSNFIFGIITSGFYKYAKAQEGGYLAEDQYETILVIEEANKVLTGNDTAGTGGGKNFGMSGQSEFEEILDQSAGYGLFIISITQTIADMPSSVIANCGMVFAGRLSRPDDVNTVIRAIAREERYEDRDIVKWFPRTPTGWFICSVSRAYNFKDVEPVLVQIAPLNFARPTNDEIDEILLQQEARKTMKKGEESLKKIQHT